MIAYLEGVVAQKDQNELVIDVNGVGYLLTCSMTTLANTPPAGERARVFTYMSVREDGVELFGFSSLEEKRMFQRLTSVSGIGPKTAVNILGSMPLRDLTLAIMAGDTTALARAQGIGKKTAQRIALELKEKVDEGDLQALNITGVSMPVHMPKTDAAAEAIEALIALGYTSSEAARAVSEAAGQSEDTQEIVMLALRGMAGRM
ncbi:MAG: Holliday junction branch migration protein RuvA [Clostridia bacterium]|nr:Holliday junction branch migration protein RuvA [Clostridia bacterium]